MTGHVKFLELNTFLTLVSHKKNRIGLGGRVGW